jgi:hypothetical protein
VSFVANGWAILKGSRSIAFQLALNANNMTLPNAHLRRFRTENKAAVAFNVARLNGEVRRIAI